MANFLLRSIPGETWPAVPNTQLAQLWALHLELERTQWLDPAAIVEGQLAQVRTLLTHCREQVLYYRQLFERHGIRPEAMRSLQDFRRIPVLERATYQRQMDAFRARELPAGTQKLCEDSTSGTSGMPVSVTMTNTVALWWYACYLRDLMWSDLDPRGTMAVIRYLGRSPPNLNAALEGLVQSSWQPLLAPLLEMGPIYTMDIRQDMRKQMEWLLRVQPDYLFGSPPNLEYLGGLIVESGRRLARLKAVQVYSETLTAETRAHLETSFGVPVKNMYSCTEVGYIASPCPQGQGLHVHAENVIAEVLDERGDPCRPGDAGRVVLTPLHNFATPLIRYEILDGATLGPEACACGRGLPLLTNVEGRRRPLFKLPDGRRKDSRPMIVRFPKGASWQRQIIQKAVDHIIIRLVPRRDQWRENYVAEYRRVVQEYFEAPIRVDVDLLDRLEIPTGGKIRDIISEVA